MPSAQVIAIGTELLLGVIQDTNTAFIAKTLNQFGVDVFKTSTIGDNEERIAREIRTSLEQADIVITTGGLGPTIDDPTRQAVARAFEVALEYHPELWEQIEKRFRAYGRQPSENNKRQAFLPDGAQAIENPVGTAPAFAFVHAGKVVVSLPGVPSEMKTLLLESVMPLLQRMFKLAGTTLSRTLHTAGLGESNVDELVADLEALNNPTVGLAAHPGQVDIRITAKADDLAGALALIAPVEALVRARLGLHIYGCDGEKLGQVTAALANAHNLNLDAFYESPLEETVTAIKEEAIFVKIESRDSLGQSPSIESLYNDGMPHDFLSLSAREENGRNLVELSMSIDGQTCADTRSFGGHPALYPHWVKNHIINFVRQSILKTKGDVCKK